jgi:hypothetical protein
MLIDMIVNKYWKEYQLIVNPITPLLIQKIHNTRIEDISYRLVTNESTYHTSVEIINEKWNVLLIIN